MWSLSPAHSCSLSPRDLTARLCPWPPVARTHCRAHARPGPASHPPAHTRVPVALTAHHVIRVPGSACTVHVFAHARYPPGIPPGIQTPTCPLCPRDPPWGLCPPRVRLRNHRAALLLCVATCREPRRPQCRLLPSPARLSQSLGLQGARSLAVFRPALSPQNDLPASTPASKSCDSSPPQDASTPGPSSAGHLRQLAAKPTPSTDSIGEYPLVPARADLLGGRGLDNGRRRGGGRRLGFQPWHCLDSQLDAAWLWALVSSLSWLDGWEN